MQTSPKLVNVPGHQNTCSQTVPFNSMTSIRVSRYMHDSFPSSRPHDIHVSTPYWKNLKLKES